MRAARAARAVRVQRVQRRSACAVRVQRVRCVCNECNECSDVRRDNACGAAKGRKRLRAACAREALVFSMSFRRAVVLPCS